MKTYTRQSAIRNPQSAIHNRPALTLVEMLVAMALTIFIMAILSEAFAKGMQAIVRVRQTAEMEQNMRTTLIILRNDIQAGKASIASTRLSTITDTMLPNPINQGQIPPRISPFAGGDPGDAVPPRNVVDVDGDGQITFMDLNHAANGNSVLDLNGNGEIDAGDLLQIYPTPEPPGINLGGWVDGVGNDNQIILWTPPTSFGFFTYGEGFDILPGAAVGSTKYPTIPEGVDASNRPVERDTNDFLHFTALLPQELRGTRNGYYYGLANYYNPVGSLQPGFNPLDNAGEGGNPLGPDGGPPPTTAARFDDRFNNLFTTPWAELTYFLQPHLDAQGQQRKTGGANPLPLFNLIRRQHLIVSDYAYPSTYSALRPPTPSDPPPNDPYQDPGKLITDAAAQLYKTYYQNYDASAFAIQDASGNATGYSFTSLAQLQFPERRFGIRVDPATFAFVRNAWYPTPNPYPDQPYPTMAQQSSTREGADLVLSNVLSFDIKIWDPSMRRSDILLPSDPQLLNKEFSQVAQLLGEFVDLGHRLPTNMTGPVNIRLTNARSPADVSAGNWGQGAMFGGAGFNLHMHQAPATPDQLDAQPSLCVYDTWTTGQLIPGQGIDYTGATAASAPASRVPYPLKARALQIKIRIYDPKSQQTRETTLIQAM